MLARYAYEAIFAFANGLTGLFNNSVTGSVNYSPSEIATTNAAAALSGQIRTHAFAGKVQSVVNVSKGNVKVDEIRVSNYRPQQTDAPTVAPSAAAPNHFPTAVPSEGSPAPTRSPTDAPIDPPPSSAPSAAPTDGPNNDPTPAPSTGPTTGAPTVGPTRIPRCEDDKFGSVKFCSEWCDNTNHWSNCADNTLPGSDSINTDNTDYTCSCQGCNGCAARCDDKTLFGNGTAWHSSAGSWYDCSYYGMSQGWQYGKEVTNCDFQGGDSNQGITAYSACCACGGGNRDSVYVAGGGGALATGAACAASPDTLNGMVLQLSWLYSTYDITVGETVVRSDAYTRRRSPMQWSARYNSTVSNNSHKLQEYSFTLANTSSYSSSCSNAVCLDGFGVSMPWYDSDGPTYDCAWYSTNCDINNINQYANCGYNAQQACCACGAKQAAEIEFKCGSSTLIAGTSSYSKSFGNSSVEMQVIQLETPKCCTEPEPTASPTAAPTNPPACYPMWVANASQTIGAACSDNSQCKSNFCENVVAHGMNMCMCASAAAETVVAAAAFVESTACDGSDRPDGMCSFTQVGTYTELPDGACGVFAADGSCKSTWHLEMAMGSDGNGAVMFPDGNGAIPPSASIVTVGVLIPSSEKYSLAILSAKNIIKRNESLLAGYVFNTAVADTTCLVGQGWPDSFSHPLTAHTPDLNTNEALSSRTHLPLTP